MNWKTIILGHDPSAELATVVGEETIAEAERVLQVTFPPDFRSLFFETGGITADYGTGVIWKLSDIISRNNEFRSSTEFRELYMPFDNLLFFGDDGGGDQFALAIHADGIVHKPDIYRWEHETDARSWFSSGLFQFFEKRLSRCESA